VFENMGLFLENRSPVFAFSTAVAVINGVVGGAALAIAVGAVLDAPLGLAVGIGAVAAIISVVVWVRHADRLLDTGAAQDTPLYPTPAPGGGSS
jgi:hypothetical protein